MPTYTVPRQDFDLLLEALRDRKKAENLAKAIESAVNAIDDERARAIAEKMGTYTIPCAAIDSFHEVFGDRRKAEDFAKVFESAINAVAINNETGVKNLV